MHPLTSGAGRPTAPPCIPAPVPSSTPVVTLLIRCMEQFPVIALWNMPIRLAGSLTVNNVSVRFTLTIFPRNVTRILVGKCNSCSAPAIIAWPPFICRDSPLRATLLRLTSRRQVSVILTTPRLLCRMPLTSVSLTTSVRDRGWTHVGTAASFVTRVVCY